MDVFDLAAKISLDTSPFEKGLDSAKGKMSAFGDVFKANIASDVVSKGFSAIVSGTKAAVGGIKNLVDQSQQAYGDYQQMVGGVQKLYGNMGQSWKEYAKTTGDSSAKAKAHYKELEEAQNLVMKNADKAYQTSGMSANQYMETATQFSASLIKSLGGDTKKAAEQTDVAMRAISDNFNTFGGNIEDVINAYKGFSKQNYTMLDNLKLGYGGTKTEMENLIKDANAYAKSIGQAGDLSINKFSDIVQAIQLIQEKQQIAGTTAREASTTLQGSMLQMQSAWENLKTAIADPDADLGKKVDQLVETITGRAATAEDVAVGAAKNIGDHINGYLDNLLPVISKAIDGIANLVSNAAPIIAEQIPNILEKLVPPVLTAMASLASTIIENLPSIVQSIEDALTQSFSSLGDTSVLAEKVSSMIAGLSGAVAEILPNLINIGTQIITAIIQGLTDNADQLLNGAAQIVTALGNGIITNLPLIVNAAVEFLQKFVEYINENQDQIQGGIEALVNAIVQGIITLAPNLTQAALTIVTTLGGALIDSIPTIVEQLPEFVSGIMGAITDTWNNSSAEEKASIAAVLAPIITGGIGDAIEQVKNAKDLVGKGADIIGKIFKGGDKGGGVDSEMFDMLDDLDPKISKLDKLKEALSSIGTTIGGGLLNGVKSLGGLLTGTVFPAIAGAMPTILPIVGIIAGIAAAIAGVILVIKNWDKVSAALKATWEALKDTASTVWNGITKVVTGAWDKIKGGVKEGAEKVKSVVGGAWDKIKSTTSDKWKAIKGEVEKNGGGIKGVIKTAAKSYLKPWKDGFEALNKASGGKLGQAVAGVQKNLAVMKAKFKAHNAAMKVIAKGLVDKVKEGWSGIKDAGGNFVKGLWEGVNNKVEWVKEKMAGFGKQVLGALKKFFKIESPSKVMRDEVGAYLAQGVAVGIKKDEGKAVKAATNMAKRVLSATKSVVMKSTKSSDSLADSVIKSVSTTKKETRKVTDTKTIKSGKNKGQTKTTTKNKSVEVKKSADEYGDDIIKAGKSKVKSLQDANKMSYQQEASFWISIANRAGKNSQTYGKAMKLAGKAVQNNQKASLDAAKNDLQEYQNLHDTSAKYEASYWKKFLGAYKKGSKEDLEVRKLYKEATEKINQERLQKYQDFVNNYSALNHGAEMTAKEQADYWKEARKDFKKGSDEWIEAQKSYQSAQKTVNDGIKSAYETFKQSAKDAKQTYENALQSIVDTINQKGETLYNSLGNWYAKFDEGDPVSAAALVEAQNSRVNAYEEGKELINQIGDIIGRDSPFFKQLEEMGYENGMAYWKALLSMGDEGLKQFAQTEDDLLDDNKNEAKNILEPEITKQRADAFNTYTKSFEDAMKTMNKSLTDLGVTWDDVSTKIRDGYDKIGQTYAKAITKGAKGLSSLTGTKDENVTSLMEKILPSPEKVTQRAKSLTDTLSTVYTTIVPSKDNPSATKAVATMNSYVGTAIKGVQDIVTNGVTDGNNKLDTLLSSLETTIQNHLEPLASKAKTWGEDMVQGFIDGMKSMFPALQNAFDSMASIGKDTVGFSEPKRGPLSDFHTYAPDMIDLFAGGIKDNGYKIADAFDETLGMNQPDDYGSFTVQADPNAISNTAGINQILSVLQQYLPQLGNQQIYLDGRTLVGATVGQMNEELAYVNNRKAGAFA